jgi:hypothetical protein
MNTKEIKKILESAGVGFSSGLTKGEIKSI